MTTESKKIAKAPEGVSFRLEQNYPLSRLTTFGIGGPADWVAFCESAEEVRDAARFAEERQIPYFVIGGGSNILASDKGFRGLVVVPRIDFLEISGTTITVGATRSLAKFVDELAEQGLAGIEALAGIAGTVGGAIVGNAGAYGQSISDTLIDVQLYNHDKGLHTEVKSKLGFRYRHSDLKGSRNIVLSGRFELSRGDAEELLKKTEEIKQTRSLRHPHENISAGCFFKNIEDATQPHGKLAAGYLLDQVGAKQMSVGKAGVYPNHANILINKGGATASEVRQLSLELKRRVKEEYGVELSEEVVLLGDFS